MKSSVFALVGISCLLNSAYRVTADGATLPSDIPLPSLPSDLPLPTLPSKIPLPTLPSDIPLPNPVNPPASGSQTPPATVDGSSMTNGPNATASLVMPTATSTPAAFSGSSTIAVNRLTVGFALFGFVLAVALF